MDIVISVQHCITMCHANGSTTHNTYGAAGWQLAQYTAIISHVMDRMCA
jgi:hypothetical protein